MLFSSRVDVCVVDDDAAQRRLLAARLRKLEYSVAEAENGADALQQVYAHRPRVLVCDLVLPDMDGLAVCRRVRADETLDGTYVIVVTAHNSPGRKMSLLNAGADDFLEKPYDMNELRARIRNGLRLSRLQERLARAAVTDGLTGLSNHSLFRSRLDQEFSRTRRYGGSLALLMIDVDHFKAINDTYGHEIGNRVLQMTARHLERVVRDTDVVARYGGEEFVVVCPETTIEEAFTMADRLCRTLPENVRIKSCPNLNVTVSIGVSGTEDPRINCVGELIGQADQALYYSKHAGRNRVTRCDREPDSVLETDPHHDEIERLRKEVVSLGMQTKELCLQSVWALIQALEARDGYSAWHSRNVTLYTKWLTDAAGWARPLRVATANAAMLHDLGKIGVPDELLLKPRPTDEREAAILKQVPLITCMILEPLRVFETEVQIIRHIREFWDGSGTPDGLAGSSIPIGSRLLAITETFDSLTCNRASRPGRPIDDALETLDRYCGTQFDPELLKLLEQCIAQDRDRWQQQVERARVSMPAGQIGSVLAG